MTKPTHHDHEKVLDSGIHGVQPADVGMVQFLQRGAATARFTSIGEKVDSAGSNQSSVK